MMMKKEQVKQVEHRFHGLSFENQLVLENVMTETNENDDYEYHLYQHLFDAVVLMYV
jgi:hypothetical protein